MISDKDLSNGSMTNYDSAWYVDQVEKLYILSSFVQCCLLGSGDMAFAKYRDAHRISSSLHKGNDKVLMGVCDGIANCLEVDPIVVRVTWVVLTISTLGIAVIPYVVLAYFLPERPDKSVVVDVSPVSVVSDRYSEVVDARKVDASAALHRYGVHADAGHVPPVPPKGEDVHIERPGIYFAYRHSKESGKVQSSRKDRILLVIAVIAALLALMVTMANSFIVRHPDLEIFDFWPELFVVIGITVLVCFYDKVPFSLRIIGMVFCIELTCLFLPFTLGICPLRSLDRLSFVPGFLIVASLGSFIYYLVQKNIDALVVMVVLFGLALFWIMGEVGLFERIMVLTSYSKHNITSPLMMP